MRRQGHQPVMLQRLARPIPPADCFVAVCVVAEPRKIALSDDRYGLAVIPPHGVEDAPESPLIDSSSGRETARLKALVQCRREAEERQPGNRLRLCCHAEPPCKWPPPGGNP